MFSEQTLKLAPWSATKQKTATQCPFKAFHLFVEKTEEKFDEPISTSALTVGIKIHSLMELLLKKFPKDVFPHADALETMGQSILDKKIIGDQKGLTLGEVDHIHSLFEGTINMCQRILSHQFKTKSIGFTEVPVGIDYNFNPINFFDKDVFFRGKIDYLLLHPMGDAAIIDAKTGAWPYLKSHQPQLRAYEVLSLFSLKKKFQSEYNINLISIISGLAYVATEQLLWDSKQNESTIAGVGKEVFSKSLNDIAARIFNKEIKRGNHCLSCGYKHLCGSRRGKGKKKKKKELINI